MTREDFEIILERLKTYKKEYDNIDVKISYVCNDGYPLGERCVQWRRQNKIGTLSIEKIKMLKELGFDFRSKSQRAFEAGLKHLRDYKEQIGDLADIPVDFACSDGYKLWIFCHNTRALYRKGGLTGSQIEQLKEVGFVLELKQNRFDEWIVMLKAYKEEFGNLDIPVHYRTEKGLPIGNRCARWRYEYASGKLDRRQYRVLRGIGFKFDLKR